MHYSLRQSLIDRSFLEVLREGEVVAELAAPFLVRSASPTLKFDSLEEIRAWLQTAERKIGKTTAYRLLAARSYSRRALQEKLLRKKISSSVCDEILLELENLGYLNDKAYLEAAVERELNRGYGPQYIRQKLRLQGQQVPIDERRQRKALLKVLPAYQKKGRPKGIQGLLRRGFDLNLILEMFG